MKLIFIIVFFLSPFILIAQTTKELVGTWNMQFLLQPNYDSCKLPKENEILILNANGTYSSKINGLIVTVEWALKQQSIKFYNNKPKNFEATVADLLYPIKFKDNFLIIYEPESGDISCPRKYYKR